MASWIASTKPTFFGLRKTLTSCATVSSASPPQSSTATTSSPTFSRLQPDPTSVTTPETSVPGAKGKGGRRWYLPAITRVVAKLTPAALILMRTWPGFRATGSTSSSFRSSGPPHWRQIMAFITAPFRPWPPNHLTLRSIAKRCISKGGNQSCCCPPFETRPAGAPQGEVVVVLQRYRQALHAAQDQRIVPFRLAALETDLRQALGQSDSSDLRFEPRQRRAKTEMDAVTEGHVRVLGAADVEALGIVERLGIAVGRVHEGEDPLAFADRLAAHLEVGGGDTREGARGAVVAQPFLDRAARHRRRGEQAFPLLAILHRIEEAVADEVGRRLVAGKQEQDTSADDLVGRQRVAVVACQHELADHVTGRLGCACFDQAAEIVGHRLGAGL